MALYEPYFDKLRQDVDIKELCYREIEARDTPVHWNALTDLWDAMCVKMGWNSINMELADEVLFFHEVRYNATKKSEETE